MNTALTVRNHRKASPMARKKSFAKGLRSLKSSVTKRRHGKPVKRHRAGGRYSSGLRPADPGLYPTKSMTKGMIIPTWKILKPDLRKGMKMGDRLLP